MGETATAVAPEASDDTTLFSRAWWRLQVLRIAVSLVVAPIGFLMLLTLDASYGHDGLHCELGWVWDDTDDACGGYWR